MKIFARLYQRLISWSSHPHAVIILAVVSFAEASFFPIPPDVMLITMGLAQPKRVLYLTTITFVFSIAGGCLGYLIGYYLFSLAHPLIITFGYQAGFEQVKVWFSEWGFWAMAVAGFTPIPFKIFTVTAGVLQLNIFQFLIGSCLGRAARFYLVGGLLHFFGEQIDFLLRRIIEPLGWGLVAILAGIILFVQLGS